MTSSDESNVEMSAALVPMKKTTKKPPTRPTEDVLTKQEEPKKVSTKVMIHKALTELKARKGVSLYAIKKYMEENYKVNTEKLNYYIKKYIKAGVETGTIIQTKGMGATGSFRLAAVKEKLEKSLSKMTSSDESDVEMSAALVSMKKTTKKPPTRPTEDVLTKQEEPKKVSTKVMIHKALTELKSRKGVSLYAIKKYMEENYKVNTEKLNYYIKKYIKAGVETGTIIQTKGMGVTGSFRLAAVKEKLEKNNKNAKAPKPKAPKEKLEKSPIIKKIGVEKKKKAEKKDMVNKKPKPQSKAENPKMAKVKSEKLEAHTTKKKSTKAEKGAKTPTKNRAKMKRKSISSIIKPPKMKPTYDYEPLISELVTPNYSCVFQIHSFLLSQGGILYI